MAYRILMIAPEPFFTPRGTPFSVYYRLRALIELGHSVDLATYPLGEDVDLPEVRIFRPRRPPWGIRRVKIGPSAAKFPLDAQLYRLARRLLSSNRYDLIHTHEEAALLGALWKSRRGVRHLYDMHSLLSQQMYNFRVPLASAAAWVWRRLERWILRHSDAVIAICPALETAARDLRPDLPVVVIENAGIAEKVLNADPDAVRAVRSSWPWPDRFVIGYIGTFEPYQGVDLLLAAAARLVSTMDGSPPGWVLVGVTPKERAAWQAKIRGLGLESHVLLIPRVTADRAAIYQQAVDLLVSPRLSGTNTPLKLYSYLASGTPILATRHPTHTQVLDDEIAFLVDPSPEALAQGMRRAMADPSVRRQVARRAKERFHQRYGFRNFVDKTRRVIELAMRAPGSPHDRP